MKVKNLQNATGKEFKIRKNTKTGGFVTNIYNTNEDVSYSAELDELYRLINQNKKPVDDTGKNFEIAESMVVVAQSIISNIVTPGTVTTFEKPTAEIVAENNVEEVVEKQPEKIENDPAKIEEVCSGLVALFKDCEENPMNSSRFINTMLLNAKSKTACREYIINYFELQNSPDTATVKGLVKSPEFDGLFEILKELKTNKKINNRLEVYYGPAGTGKTTKAIQENPGAAVIPCNYSMDCEDLFKVVTFNDGKIEYQESPFIKAMQNGAAIILDEINLLNDNMIATLQTITDNKTEFTYGSKTYQIKPGFKIIGTMNLIVNGIIYPLRPALVDRCENILHIKANYKAIFNRAL